MKTLTLAVLILNLFSQHLRAETDTYSPQPDRVKMIFSCKDDTDCILKPGVCGAPTALNKNQEIAYSQWLKLERQLSTCAEDLDDKRTQSYLAACVAERCTAKAK